MRFPSRRGPTATYAAIIGDRYLWVALDRAAAITLHAGSGTVDVPGETDDTQPGHHGVRLDLGALADPVEGEPETLEVRVGRGRPLPAPPLRPSGPATRHELVADAAGHLHVVRRHRGRAVTVRGLRLVEGRVEIDLDSTVSELRLVDGDAVVATLPVVGRTAVLATPDLAPLTGSGPLLRVLAVGADGPLPVRRRANDLADPGAGALLPAVHAPGAPTPTARLRWSAEGDLAVRLVEGRD